jgi:uncharacterized protein DUF3575
MKYRLFSEDQPSDEPTFFKIPSISFRVILKPILCVLLIYANSAVAQETKERDNKIVITFAPLALADIFDGPSCRLGAELKVRRNISCAVEGGGYLKYVDVNKINTKGFLIKPTVKYYLNKNSRIGGRYLALEYMFKDQDYDFEDSMATGEIHFERQYAMKRTVNTLSVKYGDLINYGQYFILEWYAGIGVRHIRSKSALTKEEENMILSGSEYGCLLSEDFIRKTGTMVYPNFLIGLKIGLRID